MKQVAARTPPTSQDSEMAVKATRPVSHEAVDRSRNGNIKLYISLPFLVLIINHPINPTQS